MSTVRREIKAILPIITNKVLNIYVYFLIRKKMSSFATRMSYTLVVPNYNMVQLFAININFKITNQTPIRWKEHHEPTKVM